MLLPFINTDTGSNKKGVKACFVTSDERPVDFVSRCFFFFLK